MSQLLKPDDLRQITQNLVVAEEEAQARKDAQAAQAADDLKQAFEARKVAPEAPERINAAVRMAAERGESEILVVRFPSAYCNDRGRRINNQEKDWPDSLEGFGKTAFDFYDRELRPLGFTLRAEIMNFPDGFPGDVGLYLRW